MTSLDLGLNSKSEWIEVFPFGIAMGVGSVRPVMIFKDKPARRVLPVWMSPMDAGIAVAQGGSPYMTSASAQAGGSPHELSWRILSTLGVSIEKCLFKKIQGHRQFVELHLVFARGTPDKEIASAATDKSIRMSKAVTVDKANKKAAKSQLMIEANADDAISFCLRSGCKFFATVDYIERSRVMESEMLSVRPDLGTMTNPHPYLN